MIYPCDKEVLLELLKLIDVGECHLALKTWSDYRHHVTQTCSQCPYVEIHQSDDCCQCLEGKLRTLSLYEHGDGFDDALMSAARKLEDFHQQTSAAAR